MPDLSLQEAPDSPERARWELAAMTGRLRAMEARLVEEQERARTLRAERDRERRRADRLRGSESYRLGYGLVSLVKDPVQTVPRLSRAVLRRLRARSRRAAVSAVPGRSVAVPDCAAAAPGGVPAVSAAPGGVPAVPGRVPAVPRRVAAATRRSPAHLYVVIGLDTAAVRDFVHILHQRLLVDPDHRPVVVTDDPNFSLLRDLGVLLEYLPDRATWERHRPELPWDDVLSQRLSRLYRDHDTVRTIIVDRPLALADLLR